MTKTITLEAAINDALDLIRQVAGGNDELVITDNGIPLAKLVPAQPPAERGTERAFGLDKGRVHISNDFDDPLPKEIEDAFYQ